MTPFFAIWAVMAAAVLIIAVWRQLVDLHEDDSIHLGDQETAVVKEQATMAKKQEAIGKVSRVLTVATLIYGMALGGYYLYEQWVLSGKLPS